MRKTPLKSARRRASWTAWTSLRLAHPAHEEEQKQKKRTYVVLPKPDNLIRYRQQLRENSCGLRLRHASFRDPAPRPRPEENATNGPAAVSRDSFDSSGAPEAVR